MRDRRTIVQLSRSELTALREFASRHLVDYAPRTAGAHRALAALLGAARADVEAARLASVRRLAQEYGATALLKGSTTLVAGPGGPVRANPTGTGWLATAGSGDVLSGLAGSLLAAGLGARDAAAVGAYLHGLAGRFAAGRSGGPVAAGDVAEALSEVWRDVRG